MSLNHLLLWLSAKGHGSWSQFRGAVESLCVERDDGPELPDDLDRAGARGSDLPVYQQHRFALQRLAHVEFFSKEQDHDWRVVPPVIALFPSSLQEGVLCGARSPELLEGLDRFDDLNVVRTGAPDMPERIVVRWHLSSRWSRLIAAWRPSFSQIPPRPYCRLYRSSAIRPLGIGRQFLRRKVGRFIVSPRRVLSGPNPWRPMQRRHGPHSFGS